MMKMHTLWVTAIALCLAACGRQEPAKPQPPGADPTAVPAEEMEEAKAVLDDVFVDHMHEHAAKLYDLNLALSDGDLVGAATPAYWLSQHEIVEGIPDELRDYVTGMRNAAYDVEIATDLDTARAAAKKISAQCQACHTAAGVKGISVPE